MFHIGVATQHPPLPEPGELGSLGISFIKQCLTIDPMLRPTAQELKGHPWMTQFQNALQNYAEQVNGSQHVSYDETQQDASVARTAAAIRDHEVEETKRASPVSPSDTELSDEAF